MVYEIQAKIREIIKNENAAKDTNATNKTKDPNLNAKLVDAISGHQETITTPKKDFEKLKKVINAPKVTEAKKFKLGKRRNNIRTIGEEQVYTKSTNKTTEILINGKPFYFSNPYEDTKDGFIGDSKQAQRGDCYFLAEINSIRNTKDGQEILQQNCKKNSDGSYTITLPGANIIRNEYAKQGKYCEVTGTYTITKEALEKAGRSNTYSKGDLDVVAYELAMETYRAEMFATVDKNGGKHRNIDAESKVSALGFGLKGDVLSGGRPYDAGFILTGKKSDVFECDNKRYNSVKPYKDGTYGYITREEMAQRTGADISMYKNTRTMSKAGISEVSHLTQKEQAINSMLNKYQGQEGKYAISFGVRVAENGPDGSTKAGGGHALTVLKITNDTVYVANPWHPEKIEPIPRNDFIKMTTTLEVMPVTSESTLVNVVENKVQHKNKISNNQKIIEKLFKHNS